MTGDWYNPLPLLSNPLPVTRSLRGPVAPSPSVPSYARAHWWFTAALAAIVAGFWPSFFRPMGTGEWWHTLHGITATGWVVTLIVQSGLMSRGLVRWHRGVAMVALFVLLPLLVVSALYMIAAMAVNPGMPPFLPPLLAYIDFPSLAFLLVLVGLALRNIRTPEAHKRFMSATVLLAFPPALTRLYARLGEGVISFPQALHLSFATVYLVLLALMLHDRRVGQKRLAYPLSLAFFVLVQATMGPVAATGAWQDFLGWFAALPPFSP